jgi:hypothetical protein
MIHPTMRRPVYGTALVSLCLCLMTLVCGVGIAVAAGVGDQVELKARIRAGVPLHQEPRGTPDFQRIPDGTKATVIALAQDGRWLKLALPDGRTGWVTSSYIGDMTEARRPAPRAQPSHPCTPRKAWSNAWPTAIPSP